MEQSGINSTGRMRFSAGCRAYAFGLLVIEAFQILYGMVTGESSVPVLTIAVVVAAAGGLILGNQPVGKILFVIGATLQFLVLGLVGAVAALAAILTLMGGTASGFARQFVTALNGLLSAGYLIAGIILFVTKGRRVAVRDDE